jgi:peptide/nickel transport system substrate-binding protein
MHLRENIFFSDGERFDADNVVFCYKMNSARGDSSYADFLDVVKIDNMTVKVSLKAANANFLYVAMNMVQQPSHIYIEKVGPIETTNPVNYTNYAGIDASIGTGPYVLTGWDSLAGTLTWKVNEDYWGGVPSLKNVTVRLYSTTNVMMMALLGGEIDTIYNYVAQGMDDSYLGKVLQKGNINVMTVNYTGLPTTLFFNYDSNLGANKTIRQAIRLAINYTEVIDLIALVSGTMAKEGVIPPGNIYFTETDELMYNKAQAAALLDAAGIVDTNSNGVRELNGEEINLRVIIRSEQEDSIRAWELVEEYLEEVGLGVEVSVLSSALFTSAFRTTRAFDILTFIMTPAGVAMYAGYGTTYTQRNKFCNITDPAYLGIVDGLLSTTDPGEREVLAAQIQEYYAEEASMITLYWTYYLQPYNDRLTGFVTNPYWGILCEDTYFNLAYA